VSAPLTIHSISEAFEPREPKEWLVDKVIPGKGSLALVHGDPGTKKTWAMIHLACCVAGEGEWLGREVTHGPVLIVDEESGHDRLCERVSAVVLGGKMRRDLPVYWVTMESLKPGWGDDAERLEEVIQVVRPVLVIVDALTDVMTGDENKVQDVRPLLEVSNVLCKKYGNVWVFIHHDNKSGTSRGSSGIEGKMDASLGVVSDQRSGVITFKSTKGRDTGYVEFTAKAGWVEDEWGEVVEFTLLNAGPPVKRRPPKLEKYVLEYLQTHGLSSTGEVVEGAPNKDSARVTLYALEKRGLVVSESEEGRRMWKLVGDRSGKVVGIGKVGVGV
jgi:hypothetical protein